MEAATARSTDVLKTQTLCAEGDENEQPSVTICKGHVDADTFNKAYAAEGWESDPVEYGQLAHEYWRRSADGWTRALKTDHDAEPITALYW